MKIEIDDTAVKEMIARIEGKNGTRPLDLREEMKGLTNFLLQKEILKAKLREIQQIYFMDYDLYPKKFGETVAEFLKIIDLELGNMVEDALA